MKRQTGIWVDTQKAFIVRLLDSGHTTKTITSNIESKVRIPGESKEFARFGSQYLDVQEKKQHRQENMTREFLKQILKEILSDDEIVIFGPSGMKKVLEKFLKSEKNFRAELKSVSSADSMTENQKAAWVKNFFRAEKNSDTVLKQRTVI